MPPIAGDELVEHPLVVGIGNQAVEDLELAGKLAADAVPLNPRMKSVAIENNFSSAAGATMRRMRYRLALPRAVRDQVDVHHAGVQGRRGPDVIESRVTHTKKSRSASTAIGATARSCDQARS